MKSNKQHLFTLDALRGVAALSVCLFHFTGAALPKLSYGPLKVAFSRGGLGVEIFFVISGFIIPYVLLKSDYKLKDFGNFIGKRFVRICPPSWVILVLTLLQYWVIDKYRHPAHPFLADFTIATVAQNFTYTAPFFPHSHWINGVFWTLAVEFQFYVLIGLFFTLMFRNVWSYVISCIVAAGLYYLPISNSMLFLHDSSLFMMGGATLLFFERKLGRAAFFLLLAGLCGVCYFQLGLLPMLTGGATSLAIAFAQLRSRVGTFLGNISYSLYLSHFIIGWALEQGVVMLVPVQTVWGRVAGQFICLAGTVIGAYIFYRLVEVYFINLANRLFKKKRQPPPVPVTVEEAMDIPQSSALPL